MIYDFFIQFMIMIMITLHILPFNFIANQFYFDTNPEEIVSIINFIISKKNSYKNESQTFFIIC